MAKRRENREAQTHTKKLKAKKKKTDGGNDDDDASEKEEKLQRKVKSNPRLLSNRKARNTPTVTTSKYFPSPAKEEEDSEDHFDMATSPPPRGVSTSQKKQEEEEDDSEEDEDNWEEVEELSEALGPPEPSDPVLPYESVEIEIETPEVRKRQKKKAEFETYLRRMMIRFKKDLHTNTHKVHLMCLIASGMFRNKLCSEPDLLAVTLSLIPAHFSSVSKERMDQHYLSGLLKWFRSTFTLNPSLPSEERPDPRALLERRLSSLSARDHQEMTHLFLLVLRSLQLFCRYVLSLQPIPLKQVATKGKGDGTSAKSSQETSKTNSPEPKVSPGTKRPAGGGKVKAERGGKRVRRKEIEEEDEDEEDCKRAPKGGPKPKNVKRRSVASKVSYKEESNSEEEECERLSQDEEFEAVSDVDSEQSEGGATSRTGRSKTNKTSSAAAKRKSGGGRKQVKEEEEWKEVRVEEEEEEDEMTSTGTKIRRSGGKRKEGPGSDEWLEVYLQKSSSWVCVDVDHGVGMPQLCYQNATAPLTYVVSVDQEGFVKDLGRKYDPTWMTTSRKRRVDESWWEETLQTLLGPEDEKDIKEEEELQNKLLNKPLPISINEYKNHPLYALKRHLLKYEAIYPPTAAVLGYCRKEPVFSRDCVHTLHSKDTWLKEARTVRLGEEPYKMVKGFSNRSRKARMASEQKEEKDLPLFGEWQTEEYQPPIAVDGKVPRNDYGNVYLFKACMLPVGCVHLRLPNLHRVARKLDLDAAPAVTGFDFHGGYSHAVSDGYIVCEEHEEILRAAWVEDQENQKQKEKEKKEKRATSNWTLLVKGLLIRERLKQRYSKKNQGLASTTEGQNADKGFSSDEEPVESGSGGGSGKTASETLALSWPQNRQKEEDSTGVSGLKKKRKTKREKKGEEQHLFPFEKV